MKNTFGQSLQVTIFGESHGPYIGAVLDGLAPGLDINEDFISSQLELRRPSGAISTARVEKDEYIIASGAFNGKTTGTPLSILIPNSNTRSGDYDKAGRVARPGHADYTASCKYHGFEDYRGGGHFSGGHSRSTGTFSSSPFGKLRELMYCIFLANAFKFQKPFAAVSHHHALLQDHHLFADGVLGGTSFCSRSLRRGTTTHAPHARSKQA